MAITQSTFDTLARRTEQEEPLSYEEVKELQGLYYEFRRESERALADCSDEEAGVETILLALHGYEHSQIAESAFLSAVAEADSAAPQSEAPSLLRSRIAFRLAFTAYFSHRLTSTTDAQAARRLTASLIYQLSELYRYLIDYASIRPVPTEPIVLLGEVIPLDPPRMAASLLQTRLEF